MRLMNVLGQSAHIKKLLDSASIITVYIANVAAERAHVSRRISSTPSPVEDTNRPTDSGRNLGISHMRRAQRADSQLVKGGATYCFVGMYGAL